MSEQTSDGGNQQPTTQGLQPPGLGSGARCRRDGHQQRAGRPHRRWWQVPDGEKDTSEPPRRDQAADLIGSDAEFDQGDEDNPEGLDPKAGYPAKDPRSEDQPFRR